MRVYQKFVRGYLPLIWLPPWVAFLITASWPLVYNAVAVELQPITIKFHFLIQRQRVPSSSNYPWFMLAANVEGGVIPKRVDAAKSNDVDVKVIRHESGSKASRKRVARISISSLRNEAVQSDYLG